MKTTDPIAIIEAAYAPIGDETGWLRHLAETAEPALDKGFGICAFAFDARNPDKLRLFSPVLTGPMSDQAPMLEQLFAHISDVMPTAMKEMFFHAQVPFQTVSKELGLGSRLGEYPIFRDFLNGMGIFDSTIVRATDPTKLGICISAAMPNVAPPSRTDVSLWSRISGHVAAAFRLRRTESPIEAVLKVDGSPEHLEPAAQAGEDRTALKAAALSMDRARGKLRRLDASEAVSLWYALAASRWSLIDQFDTNGRRYLVARRNQPLRGGKGTLTEDERVVLAWASLGHSSKLIAYELGLSEPTVSARLSRAARKLGARTRTEAAREYRAIEEQTDTSSQESSSPPEGLEAARIDTLDEELAVLGFATKAERLTDAEREVMLALVSDRSNDEIALARGASSRTVANQVAALFRKLGVSSRAELATCWLDSLRGKQ